MRTFEKLKYAFPLAIALGLGLTACGDDGGSSSYEQPEAEEISEEPQPAEPTGIENDDIAIDVSFEGGIMKTSYDFGAHKYSWCQGRDLVELTVILDFAGSEDRSPLHRACADGVLTPEDFVEDYTG